MKNKRNAGRVISLLLALYMALGAAVNAYAAEDNSDDAQKTESTAAGAQETEFRFTGEPLDNDALYQRYVDKLFGIEETSASAKTPQPSGRKQFDEVTEAIIKVVNKYITEVSDGKRTNTYFYIPYDEIAQYVSDPDLILAWNAKEHARDVHTAVCADYETESYWYDSSAGMKIGHRLQSCLSEQVLCSFMNRGKYLLTRT